MGNVFDYCNYILRNCDVDFLKVFENGGSIEISKSAFGDRVNENVNNQRQYMEKTCDEKLFDEIALKTIDGIFHKDKLFLGLEPSNKIMEIYSCSKKRFLKEKENYKEGNIVSFDVLFEIIYNVSLILSNVLHAYENDSKKIESVITGISSEDIYNMYFKRCTKRKLLKKILNGMRCSKGFLMFLILLITRKKSFIALGVTNIFLGMIDADITKDREKEILKLRYEYFLLMISATCAKIGYIEGKKTYE